MSVLNDWQNFYVIAGSAAGALIGLQFVVLTLLSSLPRKISMQGASVYSTPTIIHFTTVLMLSALMVVPIHGFAAYDAIAAIVAAGGLAGCLYALSNARQMRRAGYKPELQDWIFYAMLPVAAYFLIAVAAMASYWSSAASPYCIAAATLLLLLIGIHNAWDTVTYHFFDRQD